MFELPEYVTLCRQINDTLKGRTILRGCLLYTSDAADERGCV